MSLKQGDKVAVDYADDDPPSSFKGEGIFIKPMRDAGDNDLLLIDIGGSDGVCLFPRKSVKKVKP